MELTVLMRELKAGNEEAFATLFRHYYPRLMAYVVSVFPHESAEDIVQDIFLYVWEHREKLYESDGFQSYLFQTAQCRCLDRLKRSQSAEKYNMAIYEVYLKESAESMMHDEITDSLSMQDFYKRLYALLDKLPEPRRKVFVMAYIEERRVKEIAALTHMPVRTVESHLYLTLKYLRKHMSRRDFRMFCLAMIVCPAVC